MKLKVYQQGGGLIYTPFIPGRTESRISGSSGNSSEDGPKIDPLDKEILALMKDQNLLPSDIQAIFNSLTAFQRKTQHLSTVGLGTDAYRSVMPGMLQITKMVSIARANKDQWDKSVAEVKSHDAGSEVALDGYGRIWVMDKDGKLSKINPKDFDSEKYVPVSNSQLLFYRQRNNDLAFSDDIFGETGMDVVGMEDIRKELDDMIGKLGTIKTSDPRIQLFSEIAKDLQGVGVFQITKKYSKADLVDFSKLLYNRLGASSRHLINANSAISGNYTPYEYILSIIRSETSSEDSTTFDADLTKSTGLGGNGNNTDEKLLAHNTYQIRFANGDGVDTQFLLTPTAAKINDTASYLVHGKDSGPMVNMKLQPLGQMNLLQMFFGGSDNVSALATSVNTQDITFGNHPVTQDELAAIFYNNESQTVKVYLPYKDDNGHIRPDFEKFEQFNAYVKELKDNPNMSKLEKNALLQKYSKLSNADIKPSEDGKSFTLTKTMPFLAFSAYAGDDTIKFNNNEKQYLAKVDRAKGKRLVKAYDNALKYNTVNPGNKPSIINKGYAHSESGDFWEGVVFVAAPNSFAAYHTSSNEPVTKSSLANISPKVAANEMLNVIQQQAIQDPNYDIYSTIGQHW